MPICAITKREHAPHELTLLTAIRPQLAIMIKDAYPDVSGESLISFAALGKFRSAYVQHLLEDEAGEITHLQREVVSSMSAHDLVTTNIQEAYEQSLTRGDTVASGISKLVGSWGFIIGLLVIFGAWIGLSLSDKGSAMIVQHPLALITLALLFLAVFQAPIIMMSQKRRDIKDRLRAENEYKISLKMQLEMRHLHEKVDYLLKQQAQRLFDLQEIQIDLMQEVATRRAAKTEGA